MMVGEKFGAYEIKKEIGRGGMGIVYKAVQLSLGREVAIKILPPQLSLETEFVQRFFREARSAANLKHPNIVTIHDVGEEKGTYYFAMEYLEGGSLEERIKKQGAFSLEEAESIISQIAGALDYAHNNGIIHRDIKPGNIIIDGEGRAVITDFGIAKAAYDQKLTKTGMSVGSPEYMSPEQVKGHEIDGRADIYSLGIVFYQMLCGKVPYTGDSAVSIAYLHVNEPIPSIRDKRKDLPPYLDSILQRLMAKDPGSRFQSGHELVKALAEKEVIAPVEESYQPFFEPERPEYAPAQSAAFPIENPPVSQGGRRKLIYALGAVLCILAVAIIAVLMLSLKKPAYPPRGGAAGGVISPQVKSGLDRSDPKVVADAMLTALQNSDVSALKTLLSTDQKEEMEEAQTNNPAEFQKRLTEIASELNGISAAGELRMNRENNSLNAFIRETEESAQIFCIELSEKIGGYEVSDLRSINRAVFFSWPAYDRTAQRHDYLSAAQTADRALAAIHSADVDSLWAVITRELQADIGDLTPDNRRDFSEELLETSRIISGIFRISEIRKDGSGRLFGKIKQQNDQNTILYLGLVRINGVYLIEKFDDMEADEFNTIPLVWKRP